MIMYFYSQVLLKLQIAGSPYVQSLRFPPVYTVHVPGNSIFLLFYNAQQPR